MKKNRMPLVLLPIILAFIGGVAWVTTSTSTRGGSQRPLITVYKSPSCGCCVKWEEHLKAAGFEVASKPRNDMNNVKAEVGVPADLQSCHTAMVEGYVVEGHVPASSIKKLLAERPDVKGLSVPGMPIGSPGMEGPNPEKYDVLTFSNSGQTAVFEKF